MASKSQRGYAPSQVRQSMSVPGVVRFVNRTGVVASNIKFDGFGRTDPYHWTGASQTMLRQSSLSSFLVSSKSGEDGGRRSCVC